MIIGALLWATTPMRADAKEKENLIERNTFTYPVQARRLGIEGEVTAVMYINKDGQVVAVETEKDANPLLAKATQKNLSKWHFPAAEDAAENHYRVAVITLNYRLNDSRTRSVYLAGE